MTNFAMTTVEAEPYLYEEHECGMDPQEVSASMGETFRNVMDFMKSNGLTSADKVLSVYHSYDPNRMTYRAGFTVSKEDAAKAKGDVKAATTPAGEVLTFTHVGPYSGLRDSYGEMMRYLEDNGLKIGAPTWEVYVNDPSTVPESALRTDVFVSLA